MKLFVFDDWSENDTTTYNYCFGEGKELTFLHILYDYDRYSWVSHVQFSLYFGIAKVRKGISSLELSIVCFGHSLNFKFFADNIMGH